MPAGEKQEAAAAAKPPKVIVATEPTELIVVFGAANWSPIEGTNLLYVSNSEGNLFKDIETQKTYVLLSGRWFEAPSIDGPWTFVPARIAAAVSFRGSPRTPRPPACWRRCRAPGRPRTRSWTRRSRRRRRSSAAGPRSRSPTTAPRSSSRSRGRSCEYATNTTFSVIRLDERYYSCHQAVWYVAGTPQGPWQVAEKVPDEIYTIPPSNQHYNTTYVHVYDATPDVVYTGYYPGYVNSYVYGGCVVYGTGCYYPPYVSPYFYHPWYPTWGWASPGTPGTAGASACPGATGRSTFTVGFAGYGGTAGMAPHGYHPPYYGGYPPRPGVPPGHRPGGGYPGGGPGGPQVTPNNNLYARPGNAARNASMPRDKSVQPANRVGPRRRQQRLRRPQRRRVPPQRRRQLAAARQWRLVEFVIELPPRGLRRQTPAPRASTKSPNLNNDYQSRSRGSSRANTLPGSRGGPGRRR